ncbi:MAG: hypothetical protein ABIG70_14020 [Pseudomonadota bacterium]|jgi:hypothetical protein|nr:hypothetical protein [Gammaproteobacteria bacterium]MBU1732084.1 hypothetical protein [Gammaproteobacteria bacterium]MBU1893386.1 hypothetical protein [Gammaproteobacteria bacterium]
MRNVPSIPPLSPAAADAMDVKPVSYLRAAQVVGERSLTPLVFPHHRTLEKSEPDTSSGTPPSEDRRREVERRRFCRRINQKDTGLYDTRAAEERRSGNRRESDITTKIEENI